MFRGVMQHYVDKAQEQTACCLPPLLSAKAGPPLGAMLLAAGRWRACPCCLPAALRLTSLVWKHVQPGTPSLNFSLIIITMDITCSNDAVAASK
jgi:hypothetical protein